MDERRTYQREELAAAMICVFTGGALTTHCLVKNVSLDGALVECPLADEGELEMEIGDRVALWDILDGCKALFNGNEGEVVWIYKRFIGIHFTHLIKESPESLSAWLEKNKLA